MEAAMTSADPTDADDFAGSGEKVRELLFDLASEYADAAAGKFASPFKGQPEDQLRNPIEDLLRKAGKVLTGAETVNVIGEYSLSDLRVRPDFGIEYGGAFCGYVEVKAPSKSADPTTYRMKHDRGQWEKLSTLPNVIYTNGSQWTLWRHGELAAKFEFLHDVTQRKGSTAKPADIDNLFGRFFSWHPTTPGTAKQLAEITGRLCRYLRADVLDLLANERRSASVPGGKRAVFTQLAATWREMLFENATDDQFADQYAQTTVFGLLLAHAEGISLDHLTVAADDLARKHLLLGAALKALTDSSVRGELAVSLSYLQRMISSINWQAINSKAGGKAEPWLYFYEDFLAEYDPELRKETGSYYTPPEVVSAQVRLANEILRTHLGCDEGLSDDKVTIVDPGMGTGSYLLRIVEQVAQNAGALGPGNVPGEVGGLVPRLIGFEVQTGPFAVAELQIANALRRHAGETLPSDTSLRLFVADTLSDPDAADGRLPGTYGAIAESRNQANQIKRDVPVTLVIGNPPYRSGAGNEGGWVENGSDQDTDALLDDWRTATSGGNRQFTNMFVFFWRWAAWKALEGTTSGIVSFIAPSAWLDGGSVWAGMRSWLRSNSDKIWVIDLEGDKNNPRSSENVFAITVPVAIVMAVKDGTGAGKNGAQAEVRVSRIRAARKEKLATLDSIAAINDLTWTMDVGIGGDPIRGAEPGFWTAMPAIKALHPWTSSGISANRTWVAAPTAAMLEQRWAELVGYRSNPDQMRSALKPSRDTDINSQRPSLPGHSHQVPLDQETAGTLPPHRKPVRTVYRSFDRQWIIPDSRLIHDPRSALWATHGAHQVYLNHHHLPKGWTVGPSAVFSAYIPDLHAFNGNSGGRVIPKYRDAHGEAPNVPAGLLPSLSRHLGQDVTIDDLFAYEAAILSHPGYLAKFYDELDVPQLRLPITADSEMWNRLVTIGNEVIWLHTFAERALVDGHDQSNVLDCLPEHERPKLLQGVPGGPGPDEIRFAPMASNPKVGVLEFLGEDQVGEPALGRVGPVTAAAWNYEISGFRIVERWFSYRKCQPAGRRNPPLSNIGIGKWEREYNRELLELISVLTRLTQLEAVQGQLLDEVMAGELILTKALDTDDALALTRDDSKPATDQLAL